MQYYIQSRFNWLRLLAIYTFIAGILLCIELIGLTRPMKQLYIVSTRPLARVGSSFAYVLNSNLEQLRGMWQAFDELKQVKKENAVLQAEISQLEAVKKENQALKALLEPSQIQGAEQVQEGERNLRVIATVIGYSSPTIIAEETVLKAGQLVLLQDTLLGLISTVFENQASVELLSSSQIKPIIVRSESGVEGIITGSNKRIFMTDIAKDSRLKTGEKVRTSGQDGVPAGLFVGTVGELIQAPTAPVLTYSVTQPVSFFNTTIVEVR